MLEAIVLSKENDVALTDNASAMTIACYEFCKRECQASHLAYTTDAKVAAGARGIALRSLVKSGKLAVGAGPDAKEGKKDVHKALANITATLPAPSASGLFYVANILASS
ncbi:Variable major outer membrane lipoprotein [Borrelia duttonii CR2A]|uniref:Variable large protein n=1 Tax=Borrelia duttonii CR2A TaxID=1432657 RepID=W6TG29_9SPIR|nr:Variable major outer membrane lipoprotein [Borrelia duttonii CR2A]